MRAATCEPLETTAPVITPCPTAQELWQRYHRRADTDTENALIEKYLPLVSVGRRAGWR